MEVNFLRIWRFQDAPEEYKTLSQHGGDEDWVVHCPQTLLAAYWPVILESVFEGYEDSYLDGFGHVDRHILDNGDVVVIFAHA